MEYVACLTLPNDTNTQFTVDALSERFALRKENETEHEMVFLDTFDWRLLRKRLALCKKGSELQLQALPQMNTLHANTIPSKIKQLDDLPANALRERLAPIVEMRAFLPVMTIRQSLRRWDILNKDDKRVARVSFKHWTPKNGDSGFSYKWLDVLGMTGYQTERKAIIQHLQEIGCRPISEPFFHDFLRRAGHEPLSYSTKIRLTLKPDQTSLDAMIEIYRFLNSIMKTNLNGIIEDIDTEFLHDFRVALRRTRVGLSQVKHVFSEGITTYFNNEFKRLGQTTNRLRDLDVYLLNRHSFTAMVPPYLREHLYYLFEQLREERQQEQQNISAQLQSPQNKSFLEEWEHYLTRTPRLDDVGINAGRTIQDVANESIYKQYKKLLKRGRSISENSPDEVFHRLRIDGKKLRYLLEFFISLFAKKEMSALIRSLKDLQDYLGHYNDLSVQQQFLMQRLEEGYDRNKKSYYMASAIGGLLDHIYQRKKAERSRFPDVFSKFDHKAHRNLIKSLFK